MLTAHTANENTTTLECYTNGRLPTGDIVVGFTRHGKRIVGRLEGLRGDAFNMHASVGGYALDWRSVRWHG